LSLFLIDYATGDNYSVLSCNSQSTDRRPAMKIRIAKNWFDNNLSGEEGYTFNETSEIYTKTITEDELNLEFSPEDIILTYDVPVATTGFQIDDTSSISFSDNVIIFQCRYSRSINVDGLVSVNPDVQPEVGRGDLTYSMQVDIGSLGGTTKVQITPNHSFEDRVGASIISCDVSYEENKVFAFHSFYNDELCRDTRLQVVQTQFGQNVGFNMRTFRFITADSSATEAQDQLFTCNLYLEPVGEITSIQPEECSCHTKADCLNPVFLPWSEWSTCSLTCGSGTQTRKRECDQNCDGVQEDDLEEIQSCNNDECQGPTDVLVLSKRNNPMIVNSQGLVDGNLEFDYGNRVSLAYGCGITLHGQMWYFGGHREYLRQKSKIIGCQMVRQEDDLPFDFFFGSCNTFAAPEGKALLCFSDTNRKQCHLFDGENFETVAASTCDHDLTLGLANYRGSPMTTGSNQNSDCYVKTEIYNFENNQWNDAPDYPYSSRIFLYSVSSTNQAAFFIGGKDGSSQLSVIAKYENDEWSLHGNLKRRRDNHASITYGTTTIVIGGYTPDGSVVETEVWDFSNSDSRTVDPALTNVHYINGIAMYLVPTGYCSNM